MPGGPEGNQETRERRNEPETDTVVEEGRERKRKSTEPRRTKKNQETNQKMKTKNQEKTKIFDGGVNGCEQTRTTHTPKDAGGDSNQAEEPTREPRTKTPERGTKEKKGYKKN